MMKFIQSMCNLIAVLMAKAKSATQFDEALSLNEAGHYKEAFALMKQSAEGGNGRTSSKFFSQANSVLSYVRYRTDAHHLLIA